MEKDIRDLVQALDEITKRLNDIPPGFHLTISSLDALDDLRISAFHLANMAEVTLVEFRGKK